MKRVNLGALALLMLAVAGMQAINRHYLMAAVGVGVAVVMFIVHRIRVRRFKQFDQSRTFD